MKKTVTWVAVADGARARLFSNDGPGKGLAPVADGDLSGPRAPSRDIDADRPGRTFDSLGEGRHAKQSRSDPHRLAKHHFIEILAARLDEGHKRQAFDRLVLVAPPQALGDLRACLGIGVQAKVSAELPKDLTHLKDHELLDPIGKVLAI